jgi:hypothetical protein
MLSAGHCGDDGDTVYEGNGSGPAVAMGTVTGTDKGRDTLLIGAAAQGRIYDGPFASTSSRPIHTVIGNWPKTLVCTSGAVTGQHCDLRIVSVNQVVKVGTQLFTGLVRAEQIDHEVGAGTGDSGGPVVARDAVPSGFVNVYPLGTISLIADNAPCGPTLMPARCGWIVWYADVNDALARYSATIVK